MIPVDKMRLTDIIQKTTNEIPSPYDSMTFSFSNSFKNEAQAQQYFYDVNSSNENRYQNKRGRYQNDGFKQKRPRQQNTDQGTKK